jgi:hypothetical protein
MNTPVRTPFSFWSKFWAILWVVSGVIVPAGILLAGRPVSDSPMRILLGSVVANGIASLGLGFSRDSLGLIALALFGGWVTIAGLFFAGCKSGF